MKAEKNARQVVSRKYNTHIASLKDQGKQCTFCVRFGWIRSRFRWCVCVMCISWFDVNSVNGSSMLRQIVPGEAWCGWWLQIGNRLSAADMSRVARSKNSDNVLFGRQSRTHIYILKQKRDTVRNCYPCEFSWIIHETIGSIQNRSKIDWRKCQDGSILENHMGYVTRTTTMTMYDEDTGALLARKIFGLVIRYWMEMCAFGGNRHRYANVNMRCGTFGMDRQRTTMSKCHQYHLCVECVGIHFYIAMSHSIRRRQYVNPGHLKSMIYNK